MNSAALAALPLAACGGDDDGDGDASATTADGGGGGGGDSIVVHAKDSLSFDPEQLEAPAGEIAFTLVNDGNLPHTLVVEDHEDMGLLLLMLLSQHGYDVTLATSLADGIRLLDRPWHAVLSDVGLGDGSGLDIAREARASATPPRRLVAISGYGAPADIAASRDAGFDEHLVKPVDLARLLAAVREQS